MKKIIYSLVMLVALGGLFTSCISPDEPAGIHEIRYAKAEYIRALKDLTKANEAVVAAEAAFKQAQADHEKQLAALVTAQINLENQKAELQKLENEAQKIANAQAEAMGKLEQAKLQAAIDQQKALDAKELEVKVKELELQAKENELAIAEINDAIKDIENNAKVKAVQSQENLAKAQANLDETLKGIAAYAMLLTEDEAEVVAFAANVYMTALEKYNKAQAEYTNAVAETYVKTYDAANLPKGLAQDLEDAKADLAAAQKAKADFEAVAGDAASWKAEIEKLEAEQVALEKNLADVAAEWAYSQNKYRMCFESFREKIQALLEAKVEEYVGKIVEVADKTKATVALPTNNDYIMKQFLLYVQPYVTKGVLELNADKSELTAVLNPFDENTELALFTDCLKAAQTDVIGLTEIIETFKREKVIVDNEGQAQALANAKTAAEEALAIYNAHKDTLSKGLAAYAPVVAAKNALAAAQSDFDAKQTAYNTALSDSVKAEKVADSIRTVAKAQAKTDSTTAANNAIAKAKQDTLDAKAAQKAKSDSLLNGAKDFAYNINYYYKTIGGAPMDTAKVFAAIKTYASFLKEKGATHTAVYFFNGTDAKGNHNVDTVEIADLSLDDVRSGKINTYAYNNKVGIGTGNSYGIQNAMQYLVKVLKNDFTWAANTDIDPSNLQINGTLISVLAAAELDPNNTDYKAALKTADDTKKAALTAADNAKVTADTNAETAYVNAVNAEHTKVAAALSAFNTANGALATAKTNVANAIKKYADIYDSFWGFNAGKHAAYVTDEKATKILASGEDSLVVNYTFDTFEKPHNVVFVNATFDGILEKNQDLTIILANLANTTDETSLQNIYDNPKIPFVFYQEKYNELADVYFTKAKYEYLSQFEENVKTLEALDKAVKDIVKAYDELTVALAGVYADAINDVNKLTGLKIEGVEDPNLPDAIDILEAVASVAGPDYFFDKFTADFVADGEYVNLGNGDILALAKDCFNEPTYGDYATKLASYYKAEKDARGQENDIDGILYYLNEIYKYALQLEEPASDVTVAASASYKELYDACVDYLDDNIADAEEWLYEVQKAYDIMTAGADALTVNKQIAEDWLKYQETKLAEAKKFVDAAKAQYDEVIAKYITK